MATRRLLAINSPMGRGPPGERIAPPAGQAGVRGPLSSTERAYMPLWSLAEFSSPSPLEA